MCLIDMIVFFNLIIKPLLFLRIFISIVFVVVGAAVAINMAKLKHILHGKKKSEQTK